MDSSKLPVLVILVRTQLKETVSIYHMSKWTEKVNAMYNNRKPLLYLNKSCLIFLKNTRTDHLNRMDNMDSFEEHLNVNKAENKINKMKQQTD